MAATRLLCILNALLGNKSTGQRLVSALNEIPELDIEYVTLTPEDYARYRVPVWARLTNPWHIQHIARQKAQSVLSQPFDLLFVQSWEFAVAFRDIARRMPAAGLMDSVPSTIDRQLRGRGLGGWKRTISHKLHNGSFRCAASEFKVFLPMGSDCAEALHKDYGVGCERIFVTLAPQDVNVWTPGRRVYSPPMQLLFVANDFARKGGDFLLKLYSAHLASDCKLTVASNDPSLDKRALPPGVVWLRGRNRDQLLQAYQQSNLFLFPTQQDYMPQVLAEALAAGLPCIANDVGGIRDLIRDSETGFLMSPDDPPERWAERIRALIERPEDLVLLSENARHFAEQNLSLRRFNELIGSLTARLIHGLEKSD